MTKTNLNEEMEKAFDEKFLAEIREVYLQGDGSWSASVYGDLRPHLKSFLSEALLKCRKEMRGMVEGKRYPIRKAVDELGRPVTPTEAFDIAKERGYNEALSDIIQSLDK